MDKPMNRIASSLMAALVMMYIIPATLSVPYFNYRFVREHSFGEWFLFGEIVPTLQSYAWPYFVWNRLNPSSPDNTLSLLAEHGDAEAQIKLALAYGTGQGVPQDIAEAVKWYRKAADQGNATAENYLGRMYDTGQGLPQNDAEAAKWYRKAADQGYAMAQQNLAVCYATGQGVPQDIVQTYKCISLAVTGIPALDAEHHAKAVAARNFVAANMTPAQIDEAQKLVREWKPK